jgi:radical SAM-linked protein
MNYSYAFRCSKQEAMIYISHLDLMRLLNRAARRADLPVCLTGGFNPRLRITLKRALKLGIASDNEEGEIILYEKLESGTLRDKWQEQLPPGLEISEITLMST